MNTNEFQPTADVVVPAILNSYLTCLRERPSWRWYGKVVEASAQTVESVGPPSSVGECCAIIDSQGIHHHAEVIGFRGRSLLVMPLDSTRGIRCGDQLMATGSVPTFPIGLEMKTRVFDALGRPIDGLPQMDRVTEQVIERLAPGPMERKPIADALSTGICAIDMMLTVGRGQRVGIFGGSGVGKSTLIGMMARNTAADVTIVGLIGERGREVREFIEQSLGQDGRQRSVIIVSTSDESPLLRMRAALAATTVAEYYASLGKHVLLVVDSLTRYAMAARELGLAAGEPPATKGYPPSVFARLAKLVERAGNYKFGSVTAFYTVLMEGDDQQDPIADALRSLLDGHIVLSRELMAEAHFPPIDILSSLSRLMPAVTSQPHLERANSLRRVMSLHFRSADLVRIGAYQQGSDPELDQAMRIMPGLREFLTQRTQDSAAFEDNFDQFMALDLK